MGVPLLSDSLLAHEEEVKEEKKEKLLPKGDVISCPDDEDRHTKGNVRDVG